jgi:hypothetical protein
VNLSDFPQKVDVEPSTLYDHSGRFVLFAILQPFDRCVHNSTFREVCDDSDAYVRFVTITLKVGIVSLCEE